MLRVFYLVFVCVKRPFCVRKLPFLLTSFFSTRDAKYPFYLRKFQVPSKLLKFAKPSFLRRTPPQNYYFFCDVCCFCDQKLEWREGREINFFLRLFFQFAFTNKTNAPNANFPAYK